MTDRQTGIRAYTVSYTSKKKLQICGEKNPDGRNCSHWLFGSSTKCNYFQECIFRNAQSTLDMVLRKLRGKVSIHSNDIARENIDKKMEVVVWKEEKIWL